MFHRNSKGTRRDAKEEEVEKKGKENDRPGTNLDGDSRRITSVREPRRRMILRDGGDAVPLCGSVTSSISPLPWPHTIIHALLPPSLSYIIEIPPQPALSPRHGLSRSRGHNGYVLPLQAVRLLARAVFV